MAGAETTQCGALTIIFALVLFYVAIDMLRQSKKQHGEEVLVQSQASLILVSWSTPGGGVCMDLAMRPCVSILRRTAGLLSVSGGFVVVPVLKKATILSMQPILATSLAVIALVSAISVTSATSMEGMNWPIALPFATGTLIGRIFAHHLAGPKLQQGFAVVATGVSAGMLIRLFLMA